MKRITLAGLCLMAMLTSAGVAVSAAAAAPIAFRGKSATTYAVREGHCNVPKPAGVQVGDQMLMLLYVEDPQKAGAFTLAANGWKVVEKVENKSAGFWFALTVLSKRYEAGDPSEYSVTWSGTAKRGCGALASAWSGVSATEPINAHLGAASVGRTQVVRGPSITTTKPNSMVVMMGDYNDPDKRTAPPGMEDIAGPEGVMAQVLQPEAKATGNKDAKTSGLDANVGYLVALTPASGESPPPPPAPSVTGLSPSSGPTTGGTSVTISGTNFSGASAVKFGTSNAASFTVNSSTSITATSPAGSGVVDVTATTGGGTSSLTGGDRFSYTASTGKIAFRGKSATSYAVREHACKVPRPTGVVPGDEILMQVYVEDPQNAGPFTISSSGWTLVEKVENRSAGFPFQIAVLAKKYEEGDPSEYTASWTGTTSRGCGALAGAWSGVSKTEPVNAHLGAPSAGFSTTVRGPSVTTTRPNSMVVMLGDYNDHDTRTAPAGMEDVAGPEGIIAQVLQPEAGATGNKDAKTHSLDGNAGFLVALSPE